MASPDRTKFTNGRPGQGLGIENALLRGTRAAGRRSAEILL